MPPDVLERMHEIRNRLLDYVTIEPGDVVLDVGCGDGLIAFGALPRVGEHGRVIFTDISPDLIAQCQRRAEAIGVLDRCRFLVASATDLKEVSADSVDVVTVRSVLIYVDDKAQAFRESFRVLRPGGLVSVGEPVNQFTYPEPRGIFLGYDVSRVQDAADKLEGFFDRVERPKIASMMDFTERDLMSLMEQTGFEELHLDFRADIKPVRPEAWDRFVNMAGNPLSPTLREAMAAALTSDERERFVAHLRPLVESGTGTERQAFAFLQGRKPLA